MRHKIDKRYFNRDYWMTRGKRSGYSPEEGYHQKGFQWEAIAKMLVDIFGDDGEYLEAGCSFGWIIEWLDKAGVDVHGFDISEYSISHAPPQLTDYVVCSDGFELPYADAEFEVLYTFETAEHMHPDDVDKWWGELHRVLRPGAKILATICLGHSNKRGREDPDRSHQTLQPREWWYELFGRHGFVRDVQLESEINSYEVITDRLDEPLCLSKYYDWNVFGLVKQND